MIISQSSSSKKYATAYLNLYQNDIHMTDIQNICRSVVFLKRNRNFMLLACAVGTKKEEKISIVDKLFVHFSLHDSFKKLVRLLIKNNQLCLLPVILQDVCCLYKTRKNILELEIQSAEQLDQQAAQEFEAFFAQRSNMDIVSHVKVDTSLIAGVRLQSSLFLWEYSVASQLRTLRHKLFVEG